jgi:hypothetical protein
MKIDLNCLPSRDQNITTLLELSISELSKHSIRTSYNYVTEEKFFVTDNHIIIFDTNSILLNSINLYVVVGSHFLQKQD